MNTRLKQFLSAENISQTQFADTIKVVRASVSHVLAGRNKPGYDFIRAIMLSYPRLNMEWLMIGKGKMYRDTDFPEELHQIPDTDVPPHREIEDSPLLFEHEDFSETQPLESSSHTLEESRTITTETSDHKPQITVNQRKVTKVVLFFDDGTYQELQ